MKRQFGNKEQSMRHSDAPANIIFAVLFVLLIAASAYIFIQCTPYGVGLVSDSVNYINGARSIADGNGYYRASGGNTMKPITNFPPLYSIVLSLPIKLGMERLQAAWWVSLIFFVINTYLLIRLVWLGSGNRWAGLLAAALFLCMQPYLYYQFYAMSEPIYYCCTLLAFLFLVKGFSSGSFFDWLLCGLACGGAFLARYIGIVSLCAVFGAVLIFVKEKRGRAFVGLFGGSLPLIAAWLIRNAIITGNASNRRILAHWVSVDDLRHGIVIFWHWLWPARYGKIENPAGWMTWGTAGFLALSVIFCIVLLIIAVRRAKPMPKPWVMIWTYLLFNVGYLLFVVLTISLFDASVNIEERILFPAFMVCFINLMTIFGGLLADRDYLPAMIPLAAALFFCVFFAQDTAKHLPEMAEAGYGWGWEGWQNSPAMNIIRELPEDKIIYSNQVEAVSLWADRGAYALLDPVDPSSEQIRDGYQDTMNEIRRQVYEGEAVLVFFGIQDWLGDSGDNWVTQLCEGMPFIYKDTSEWVVGQPL